jgi:PEGA domain-containing protein
MFTGDDDCRGRISRNSLKHRDFRMVPLAFQLLPSHGACLRRSLVLRTIVSASLISIVTAAALPHNAEAQRRVVRRPSSRGVVVYARPYYPVYYSPLYSGWYGGWYGPGWYGWNGWYPYGFYGQYYPPYGYGYDPTGSARIDIKPREAEVYVDGYLVGTVDDFDGWLQRLHVPYGEHEIQIYLQGYRTIREKVLFRPGATLKLSSAMEPLPAGEAQEPRPAPAEGVRQPSLQRRYPSEEMPQGPSSPRRRERAPASDFGSVAIRVQPADAEVVIDGERWDSPHSPQGGDRLIVQLGEGEHRIEIRKEGYRTYSTSIRLLRGETVPLNVSLSRQEGR